LGEPKPLDRDDSVVGDGRSIDTHPLIRDFFAERLRKNNKRVWKIAHSRLFEHLMNSTPYWPEGLHGLQPLYQAIAHGCQAGRWREAYDIYDTRIIRSNKSNTKYYSIHQLGLVGVDLATLSWFFDRPWRHPSTALPKGDQALLLAQG